MLEVKTVRVNLHREPHGWWAESPDAPGFTAAAATREELEQRVESGLRFFFEDEQAHLVIMYVLGTQGGILTETPMGAGPAEVAEVRFAKA